MNFIADSFKNEHGVDLRQDKMALQRLKEAAEKAKKELSSSQTVNVNLPFITVNADGPLHLDMDITRAKFDQLTSNLVQRTIDPMKKAMADAGVTMNDIEKLPFRQACLRERSTTYCSWMSLRSPCPSKRWAA